LEHELRDRRARNSRYSLRAFSRDLGINSTSLSLFLSGKRGLSDESCRRTIERLRYTPLGMPATVFGRPKKGDRRGFASVDFDTLAMVADWYYFAILSVFELDGFRATPQRIARRLNLPLTVVEQALTRLCASDMLKCDRHGHYATTGKSFATPNQVSHLAIRRSHYQALALAKESLDVDDISKRYFTAMTMAVDPARLEEAGRRIRKFNRSLCKFLEGGEKKEVYRLCVQAFPLTR
jgi:uncharacterized protein (TIGR02147 family)